MNHVNILLGNWTQCFELHQTIHPKEQTFFYYKGVKTIIFEILAKMPTMFLARTFLLFSFFPHRVPLKNISGLEKKKATE